MLKRLLDASCCHDIPIDWYVELLCCLFQKWSRGHKARGQGQGHRPSPRTAFPRTGTLEAKDRNARGQGPRTQAQVLSKKKKRSSQKFFRRSPKKKRFPKNFFSAPQNFYNSRISAVLEPRTGQFSKICCLEAKAKAKDLTFEAKAKDLNEVVIQ